MLRIPPPVDIPTIVASRGFKAKIRLVLYSLQADRLYRTLSALRCQGGVASFLPG
jgi:hypothetical protein